MKKRALKTILVPIDCAEMSGQAIETAQQLAQRFDAAIHLVHVQEFYYPAGFVAPGAPGPMSMITFQQADADRIRRELGTLARKYGIPIANCYIRNDIPVFNGVCKVARKIDADLIVMQTHGRKGIARIFEGSQAERIVQHSPCPVLVVRKKKRRTRRIPSMVETNGSIDTILVPVDFSQPSFQALEYAIRFAERVVARLIVFHAVHLDLALTVDGYAMSDLSTLKQEIRSHAEQQMREFVRLAKFRAVKFETIVKTAPAAVDICALADERDVDLIITSTHGRTGLKHLLMGSVAERIVRHAHQPVLVVPSHPETRTARLTRETRRDQQPMEFPKTRTSPRSSGRLARQKANLIEHSSPERRKTNKFRESHSRRLI